MTQWRMLVVDDEPVNLEIIRESLDDAEYQLDMAASAEEAWRMLDTVGAGYHLAILDRMMPGMDGIDLLKKMKQDDRLKSIPVIMQTAAAAPEQVAEGIGAGAHYYLTKPYTADALTEIGRAHV